MCTVYRTTGAAPGSSWRIRTVPRSVASRSVSPSLVTRVPDRTTEECAPGASAPVTSAAAVRAGLGAATEIPCRSRLQIAINSVLKMRIRRAENRTGWEKLVIVEQMSFLDPRTTARESLAARTDHSPRGRVARTVKDQGFPAARALARRYRKAYAPTSGLADSQLRLARRDSRLLRAIRAALAARRHRRPRLAEIPGPSCAPRDSDPCGPRPSGPAGFADPVHRPSSPPGNQSARRRRSDRHFPRRRLRRYAYHY